MNNFLKYITSAISKDNSNIINEEQQIDDNIECLKFSDDEPEFFEDDIAESINLRLKILTEEITIIYSELDITRNLYEKIYIVELLNHVILLLPKNYSAHIDTIYNYDELLINPTLIINNNLIIKIINVLHIYGKYVESTYEIINNIKIEKKYNIHPFDICTMIHDLILRIIPHLYGKLLSYDKIFNDINKTKKYSPTDQLNIGDKFYEIKRIFDRILKYHKIYQIYYSYMLNIDTYIDNSLILIKHIG
jgi:hypothetical protein